MDAAFVMTLVHARGLGCCRIAALWIGMSALGGCAIVPGIRVGDDFQPAWYQTDVPPPESPVSPQFIPITPSLILELEKQRQENGSGVEGMGIQLEEALEEPYRVGLRDTIQVVVWNHPELTNPFGLTSGIEEGGMVVQEDGTIFFPYVGKQQVAGLTVEEIRQQLSRDLQPFIESPQVDVRVFGFRSKRVYVTGEVREPGILPITDVPLTIMDAINLAGGFDELANRRLAVLTRGGRNYPVDIGALYARGENNFILRNGDVLHVQDNTANRVFVLGEVEQQLAVPMDIQGRVTLMEAISEAGGFDLTTANTGGVYVFRGELVDDPESGEPFLVPFIYELDARQGVALILADRFQLEPRDIVFVSSTGLVRFNRVMQQILPTVQFLFQTDRLVFNR